MDPKGLEQKGSCRRVRFASWVMEHLKWRGGFAPPGTEGFTEVSGVEGMGTQPQRRASRIFILGPLSSGERLETVSLREGSEFQPRLSPSPAGK